MITAASPFGIVAVPATLHTALASWSAGCSIRIQAAKRAMRHGTATDWDTSTPALFCAGHAPFYASVKLAT
ncbi:hypothetical protein WS67_11330 [Burkholderia singularis]|uniref:Uncharacterized protein n=1 Tax=Burkholderia singularis TaxID=1503053 RepID=A0A103E3K4_9BURK|nr:hypothetical protein WS67_11330 [Burkholderia singularis]